MILPTHRHEFKLLLDSQLINMWLAGNGTFIFRNCKTSIEFIIRMRTKHNLRDIKPFTELFGLIRTFDYLPVSSYIVDKPLQLNGFAKYNFSNDKLLRSNSLFQNEILESEKLIEYFTFLNDLIISGRNVSQTTIVYYDGTCARCGKELKSQKSIAIGFGSECENFFNEQHKIIQMKLSTNFFS